MEKDKNIELTAAELSNLWDAYQSDTLAICIIRYFLNHVDDDEIHPLLQRTLDFTEAHIPKIIAFFEGEGNPIPQGFTEDDVNETAPRLFTDNYILRYLHQMGQFGLSAHSFSVSYASRQDIHAYFPECLREHLELHKMINLVMLSKGLYIRPPYIPNQELVTFVESDNLLQGWFGKKRPLLAVEITNLFDDIQRNDLGVSTLIGFSQVAQSKEVTDYLVRGKQIASKHVEVYSSILRKDNLPIPMIPDTGVTKSTVPPFSDKLMLALTAALNGIGIGYYGLAMGMSMRTDISAQYARLTLEVGKFALAGAKLMIKNGWMEQPPMNADRDGLAKKG
ncbi:DUF3231 family protein [Lentibacillus sp. N15]|uniref:DUF3231 family protein n=1 Tax=Lentibacillus songyuanensis TaxID=3136161 RepID=UPI0031B9D655